MWTNLRQHRWFTELPSAIDGRERTGAPLPCQVDEPLTQRMGPNGRRQGLGIEHRKACQRRGPQQAHSANELFGELGNLRGRLVVC